MQKTRSIFVKVLVLVCALCCSLAFVFGLTGCSDEGSENSAPETITVTKVEVVSGTDKIKVTYSNGTTAEFDNTVVATCDHNLKEYWVMPATCVAPEEFLMVCDKGCGYADIEYGDIDPDNHVVIVGDAGEEYVEEVKPTCTEGGSIKITCACGEVLANNPNVPANGHSFETTQPTCEVDGYKVCSVCEFVEEASDENGLKATGHGTYAWKLAQDLTGSYNVCVDGGHEVYVCLNCFANCPECENAIADTREIPAVGHAWTNEWTVVEPTLTTAGSFSGYCEVCGTNATIVLPALNDEDYNVSQVRAAACDAKGEDAYVFVYYGNEIAKCTFTVVTEAAHMDSNGKAIDKNKVYNMQEFLLIGGELEVDSAATCLDTANGIIYCSICDGFSVVKVLGEHQRGAEITDKYIAPTCVSEGKRFYECEREGCTHEDYDVLGKLDHDYEVTVDETNKKLIFTCKGNPEGTVCGDTFSADLYDYEYRTVDATCYVDGSKTFWYQESAEAEWKSLPSKVIPAYGHYYGDPDNKLVSGKEYTYDELVAIFGADNIGRGKAVDTEVDATVNCTVSANAVAYCSECNGPVIFKALGNHEWKLVDDVDATCTEDAYKTYVCEANEAHTKIEVEEDSALGHNLVINMEESILTGSNAVMVFECDRCDYVETINGTITKNEDVASTCKDHGYHYIEFTYEDPNLGTVNDSKYLVEKKPLSNVHFYGDVAIDKDAYTYAELVAIFGEENIGRGKAVDTEVDKAFDCQNSAPAVFYCTYCNGPKIITATGDHAWSAWTVVPANCTDASYRYRNCTVEGCAGYELDSTYVPEEATGHTYVYELPEVSALVEAAYEMVVTCEDCDYEFTFTFAQLNDVDYNMVVVAQNTCANEGLTTYAITVKDGEIEIEDVLFSVVTPVTEHEGAEPPVEKTWEHDGYIYEGYYCEACDTMIITSKTEITAE